MTRFLQIEWPAGSSPIDAVCVHSALGGDRERRFYAAGDFGRPVAGNMWASALSGRAATPGCQQGGAPEHPEHRRLVLWASRRGDAAWACRAVDGRHGIMARCPSGGNVDKPDGALLFFFYNRWGSVGFQVVDNVYSKKKKRMVRLTHGSHTSIMLSISFIFIPPA